MTAVRRPLPALLAGVVVAGLALSAWGPQDRTTWFLETVWVLIGLPLIVLTWRRFPLTDLLCCLLAAHALVLLIGGHYTYAEVPFGNWLRDELGLERNPYDRFGHLMQGFVPAVLVRELLSRTSPLRGSRWLAPLTVCACLAFSAVFEMLEWLAAVIGGQAADAFLATQGDVWDTQWDMFCALIGATVSVLVWSRLHDRQLAAPAVTSSSGAVTSPYSGTGSTAAAGTSTPGTTRPLR
jgi:putative membrane protein